MQISSIIDSNVNCVKAEVSFPLYVEAGDYHVFQNIASTLELLVGQAVKYQECGCDHGTYSGVLFLESQENDKTILEEIRKIKETYNV